MSYHYENYEDYCKKLKTPEACTIRLVRRVYPKAILCGVNVGRVWPEGMPRSSWIIAGITDLKMKPQDSSEQAWKVALAFVQKSD